MGAGFAVRAMGRETVRKILSAISRACLAICAAVPLSGVGPAQADDFPSRPIHIVIAFPPGGPTDFGVTIVDYRRYANPTASAA